MSEQAPFNPEHIIMDAGHELPEHARPKPEIAAENPHQKAEQARVAAERSASSTAEKNPVEQLEKAEKAAAPSQPTFINRELKSITLQRELQTIRRKLPAPERVLSRVIHQPAIRAVSEVTGKTISRPSGLLGGGLVALLGTTGYLYFAKHIGFQYNYLVFLALFAGGFGLGLILELVVWAITSPRRHAAE